MSAFARTRRAGRRRGAAALLALTVPLAAGCGGDDSDADRVRAYFDDVDQVYRDASPRFQAANDTFRKFSEGKLTGGKAELALRTVEIEIEGARQQVAAVVPPEPARHLHELVLRAYNLNVLMAAETRQLAHFVPRAKDIVARLREVRGDLRRDLDAARGLDRQSTALRAYARRVSALRDELTRLRPPPALAAAKETQLRVLGHTRSLTRQLVAAIAQQDKPAISRLLADFRRGGDPQPDRVTWEKGALQAYQQRIVELDRASAAVTRERARVIDEVS